MKEVLVAACSYEARKYGIHSAMPMKKQCNYARMLLSPAAAGRLQ
ncbi:MAG: hypothetical protein WDO19_12495 [Bacteroidota bacterium]